MHKGIYINKLELEYFEPNTGVCESKSDEMSSEHTLIFQATHMWDYFAKIVKINQDLTIDDMCKCVTWISGGSFDSFYSSVYAC
jgi:hypothetical protein